MVELLQEVVVEVLGHNFYALVEKEEWEEVEMEETVLEITVSLVVQHQVLEVINL